MLKNLTFFLNPLLILDNNHYLVSSNQNCVSKFNIYLTYTAHGEIEKLLLSF